ncbi:thioredoxin domain-containing protein [Frigoribacterium sp. CFBP 13712]|uniref:DsbA family protein n=1 Tax=Frigoribacterium sp. CFBP 13712 TaxID=2775309 RepID=UPI0017807D76|nr:thioredoxin domain-containing protein [Frigoribacterium sp. CFBP 13712]MBD8703208.1 thioredoxin domain-containing protein [Frigoribacterium sp. CFBP 13712]
MTPSPGTGDTKRERRDAAREKARITRETEARRRRRNKWFAQGGLVVGVLAVIGVIALVITRSLAPAGPGPLNMASDGLVLSGDGTSVSAATTDALAADAEPVASTAGTAEKPSIVVYLDYLCPYCGQFDTANAEQLTTWVSQGDVDLEIHPLGFLDNASLGTKYSTRSANAFACVANYDPDAALDVNTALFAQQPAENTSGLTDAELVSLVEGAGADDPGIAGCITGGEFDDWVASATERALNDPLPNSDEPKVTGTPTILVNGQKYGGSLTDPTVFAQFVAEVASGASTADTSTGGTESTATPTP